MPFYAFTASGALPRLRPPLRRICRLFLHQMPPWYLPRRKWGVFLPSRRVVSPSAQKMLPFSAPNASGHPQRRIWGIFLLGRRVNPEKYLCSTKKRLPRMRKTLKCGRIYKPSSVLQTGTRRHPKKLLSFICCSLPPSNGRATLDCWYTWPCRLQ